jgi:hypothetical protein
MSPTHLFPFGQPLKKVVQLNRTPKKVFVLGVYASAVHARWIDSKGIQKVAALAVASEPEIFWRGGNADTIISAIEIPEELGKLVVPGRNLNGPSGRTLDEKILTPLGLTWEDTWLCDLLPESRINPNQQKAIIKHYTPDIIKQFKLSPATVPVFDKKELDSELRRMEILNELEESQAGTLILLGDLPIYWFLRFYSNINVRKLSGFGETNDLYGKPHEVKINRKMYHVLPLCHPRQMNRLGVSSAKWELLHEYWISEKSNYKDSGKD